MKNNFYRVNKNNWKICLNYLYKKGYKWSSGRSNQDIHQNEFEKFFYLNNSRLKNEYLFIEFTEFTPNKKIIGLYWNISVYIDFNSYLRKQKLKRINDYFISK